MNRDRIREMRARSLSHGPCIQDDPYIIAGNGTVGMEIVNQFRGERLDAVFVCCGGGGLLAGVWAIRSLHPTAAARTYLDWQAYYVCCVTVRGFSHTPPVARLPRTSRA